VEPLPGPGEGRTSGLVWRRLGLGQRLQVSTEVHRGRPLAIDGALVVLPYGHNLAGKGAGWPARAIAELRNGTLLEKDENITVSPR
jgi:hypothetical protein